MLGLRSQVKDAELSQVSRGAVGRCTGAKHIQVFVAELRPETGAEGGCWGGGAAGRWARRFLAPSWGRQWRPELREGRGDGGEFGWL